MLLWSHGYESVKIYSGKNLATDGHDLKIYFTSNQDENDRQRGDMYISMEYIYIYKFYIYIYLY